LLTGMTGISLHMQWPLTSQSHGSVSQREQLVFRYGSNSTAGISFLFPPTFRVWLKLGARLTSTIKIKSFRKSLIHCWHDTAANTCTKDCLPTLIPPNSYMYIKAGLPDGLFSNQKSQLFVNFGGSCNGKYWYIL
jgi:hypothetical protein